MSLRNLLIFGWNTLFSSNKGHFLNSHIQHVTAIFFYFNSPLSPFLLIWYCSFFSFRAFLPAFMLEPFLSSKDRYFLVFLLNVIDYLFFHFENLSFLKSNWIRSILPQLLNRSYYSHGPYFCQSVTLKGISFSSLLYMFIFFINLFTGFQFERCWCWSFSIDLTMLFSLYSLLFLFECPKYLLCLNCFQVSMHCLGVTIINVTAVVEVQKPL